MNYLDLAEKALQEHPLTRQECYAVLDSPEDSILELLQAAFRVRKAYFGKKVTLHLILNAQSGLCSEDCTYCSQSAISKASITKYPWLDDETIVEGARRARAAKARRYCIVSSGHSPTRLGLKHLCLVLNRIKREVGIDVCTSLGFLSEEAARSLKEAGASRYNHNLNTSERFYPQVCTTHTYQERLRTLQNARQAGLELCCGALFGMGETADDIINLALALRELGPDSIPINFLHPVPGTPLEKVEYLTPLKCLNILSLVRFLNPQSEIRIAGGREFHLRSLQPLGLYPANSIFVAGYLTTPGQTPEAAWRMIADMGFEIEPEITEEVATEV